MKTALDVDVTKLDEQEISFIDDVKVHGWAASHVAEDSEGPGFGYTTGFWQRFGVPELIIFSLPMQVAHQIFWNFYNELDGGKRFSENQEISEILVGYDVVLRQVSKTHYPDFFGWNRWFSGGDKFPAQQVFLPNKSGEFPWETLPGSASRIAQPDLSHTKHFRSP